MTTHLTKFAHDWFSCQSMTQAVFGMLVISAIFAAVVRWIVVTFGTAINKTADWLIEKFFGRPLPPTCIGARHGCTCKECMRDIDVRR